MVRLALMLSLAPALASAQYSRVKDEGTDLPRRTTLNFTGSGVTCTDDAANARSVCDLSAAGGGYATIQEEGVGLTARTTVNFIGTAMTCVDNAGATKTDCTVTASGAPTGAEYLVAAANATLSAERVCTDTSTVDCDMLTAAQAKFNVLTSPTATALTVDPTACGANLFVTDMAAAGTLTCTQPAFTNLSGSASIAQGGTTETASTEDAVLVGASTTDWVPKVLPSCSNATTSKLLYDSTTNAFSCGTDQTGSGGGNYAAVTVAFGATGDTTASTVVTGQAWVTSTSTIICAPTMLATSTRSEGAEDAVIEGLTVGVHTRVAGTGFTLTANVASGMATGDFLIHCTGG